MVHKYRGAPYDFMEIILRAFYFLLRLQKLDRVFGKLDRAFERLGRVYENKHLAECFVKESL